MRSSIDHLRSAIGPGRSSIGHWRLVIGDLRLAIGDRRLAISRFPWLCILFWAGGSPAGAAAEAQPLVVISPHHEFIRQEFQEAFSRWHLAHFGAPVACDWRELGGSSDALRFVQSEFAKRPDGIGIDCFFGGGQEPFLLLADRGLVLPYDSPARAGIPASFNGIEVYDREFRWYGAALSSFGILQNRRLQARLDLPFIRHWDELAQPRLLGWVGAGDPRNSGTMTVMYETILQAYGWEKGWSLLARISANTRKFDRVSSTTAKDVTLGETVYAFAVDFYGFTQMAVAGRSNVLFALPEDFTSISPDGLAILKGAPHLAVARRFVDFVLSESGQKLWLLPAGHPEGPRQNSIERMPVRPELYSRFRGQSNIEFSPFELKSSFVYNARLARGRRDVVAGLFGALFVDSHRDLQRAWRTMIQRGSPAAGLTELGRMPMTEAQASALATNEWRSATRRTQKKIEWQSWATAKYRRMQKSGAVALAN